MKSIFPLFPAAERHSSLLATLLVFFALGLFRPLHGAEPQTHRHVRLHLTTSTLTATPELIVEWPATGARMPLVRVPAGQFEMGSQRGDPDELPIHTVHLDAFWIGKYEVTAREYAIFLNAVKRDRTPEHLYVDADNPESLFQNTLGWFSPRRGFDDFPAAGITWHGAKAFCDWLARETQFPFALPTEAQWERAAHGDENANDRIFPWGVRLTPDYCRYKSKQPTRVGSYPLGVSPFGAHDMAGNVAEWVNDWYDENYYEHSPRDNPEGPTTGTLKILRGGDWTCAMVSIPRLRATDRNPMPPESPLIVQGFRVALNRRESPGDGAE